MITVTSNTCNTFHRFSKTMTLSFGEYLMLSDNASKLQEMKSPTDAVSKAHLMVFNRTSENNEHHLSWR